MSERPEIDVPVFIEGIKDISTDNLLDLQAAINKMVTNRYFKRKNAATQLVNKVCGFSYYKGLEERETK